MQRTSIFTMALVGLLAQVAAGDESARLNLSGRVVGDAGKPVVGATVTLVAGADYDRRFLCELDPDHPTVDVQTDSRGKFKLGFASDDVRFLASGDPLLIVRARAHQSKLFGIKMARIQVDVPLDEIQLVPAVPVEIEIRNADDRPLKSASVFVASIGGKNVPWAVAKKFAPAETDADGRVSLRQVNRDSLDGVFVTASSAGKQRLPVRRTPDGNLQVRVLPTRGVDGSISSPTTDSIPDIATTSLFVFSLPPSGSIYDNQPLQCCWNIAPLSKAGKLHVPALGLGKLGFKLVCPADFPYRQTAEQEQTTLAKGDSSFQWNIEFKKQVKLKAKIIDAVSGEPLKNILISSYDGRHQHTFTNAEGMAEFFRLRDHVSYYPRDALGKYFCSDAFFKDSKKVPVDGVIELEPTAMNPCLSWQGKVVDELGEPVAGAKLIYEFSQERFNRSQVAYSNTDGMFRLADVADRTALKIRAVRRNAASEPASIVVPTKDAFQLSLTERTSLQPTGRIVNLDGKPLSGISVLLKRGVTMIKEGYSSEELTPDELYDPPQKTRSDSLGRFTFPPTINFQQRLQVQVLDPNCFPYHSPFVDFSNVEGAQREETLELGDFPVMRRGKPREVRLSVESDTGASIPNAEVVVVGARTGTVRGKTDDSGSIALGYKHGHAVVAVSAPGYRVHFAQMPAKLQPLRIVLQSESTALTESDNSITNVSQREFQAAAEQVFASIPPPDPANSTFHRLRTYLDALVSVDPENFITFIQTEATKKKDLLQYAGTAASSIVRRTELVEHAIDQGVITSGFRPEFFFEAAAATDDPELQEEWLGEALVAARNISSPMKRGYILSMLSAALLSSRRTESAQRVITEVWASASNLQQLVASGERKMHVGESRGLGPVLAIIDLELSRKLIRLTAREIEIDRLLTEAELYRAQAYPDEFIQALEEGSLQNFDTRGIDSWLRRVSRFGGLLTTGVPHPEKVAQTIPDAKTRLAFALFHARGTDDLVVRKQLMRLAVASIREASSSSADDHFLFHYTGKSLPELRKFKSIDPQVLDQLVFATLWNMPEQFDTDRFQTVLGGAAQILALRDRELAQVILEPAFQDRGWLFMGRHLNLTRNTTLNALAGIDPQWCVEVVDRICREELRHDPVDQMELRAGVAKSLITVGQGSTEEQ